MSVKESVYTYIDKATARKNKLRAAAGYGLFSVLGFVYAVSGIGSEFSPFGIAFVSASGKKYFAASFTGAVLGYIINNDTVTALRYVASLLALAVIGGALRPFKNLRDNRFVPPAAVFLCLGSTGLAIVLSHEVTLRDVLLCCSESLIGAGSAYLFAECRTIMFLPGSIRALNAREAASLVTAASLLLLAVRNISFGGVYPARIICELLILVFAFYAREAGGAVIGVCCGMTVSFGTGNVFLLAFYSFGGLMAGAFSALGRIAVYCAFFLAGIAVSATVGDTSLYTGLLAETLVAGVVFLLLPKRVRDTLEKMLTPYVNSPVIDSIRSGIVKKMKNASAISADICSSLTGVSQALSKSESADIKDISRKTRDGVCGSCGLYDVCWNESFDETQDVFNTLISMKKEGNYLEYKNMPRRFTAKCIRSEMIAAGFNKLYTEYKIKQRLEMRVNEIYSLASEQFINVSSLLDSLCESVCENIRFDPELASKACAAAYACGFEPDDGLCAVDPFDRLSIEIKLKNVGGRIDTTDLALRLETLTDRSFMLPEVIRSGSTATVVFKERPQFRIVSSGVRSCCASEKYSGDTFVTFQTDDGCYYAAVCDGMGTGSRAAVNSGLAVTLLEKMIKAGFGIESAVNTVNTSLISKSGDECSVTLDLTVVDLFTGHIDFYKCGAAASFVKKQGKIIEVSSPSLPLGILNGIQCGSGTGSVGRGDVIVLASDGVRDEDMPFLKESLKRFSGGNVREFTRDLCENIRERQGAKTDDLTLVTLAVTSYI